MKVSKIKSAFGRSACQDRSERTRQRLIEVAVEVFAELGFEAASTRIIVERAQANLVSIPYYFGSKLGLYHAVAEYIGTNVAEQFRPAAERARESLMGSKSHEEILEAFCNFVCDFASFMMGAETPDSWGKFVSREQFDPTEAFEIVFAKFSPMIELGCQYISRLTGVPSEAPETRLRFMMVMSMIKSTRTDRASVLKMMGWTSFGQTETALVSDMLRRNVHALFVHSD